MLTNTDTMFRCRCLHQHSFSSLNRGWHWSAVNVGGDSKRLSHWCEHDLVVVPSDVADVETHVPRRHVEASAEGEVHLGAGILEDALVVLDGRRDVYRGRDGILYVCQELVLCIKGCARA